MRDCPNAMMRDVLPDLLHGRLAAAQRAAVRAHLESCDECRAELALLGRIRDQAPTPAVDVSRIVGALPAYGGRAPWERAWRSMPLRAAAAVLVVAGAATLLMQPSREPGQVMVADSTPRYVVPQELPLGETFHDVSDADLRALVEDLRDVDAVMLEEPDDPALPIGPTEGT